MIGARCTVPACPRLPVRGSTRCPKHQRRTVRYFTNATDALATALMLEEETGHDHAVIDTCVLSDAGEVCEYAVVEVRTERTYDMRTPAGRTGFRDELEPDSHDRGRATNWDDD